MSNDDLTYYRRRAEIEAELAAWATQPEAIVAHTQLANAYLKRMGSARAETMVDHA